MNIRTQVDSVGAVRWIRRAKTMARSIKKRTGVARAILDGYLLEGRRNNKNRLARVIDLPGRFVPYGRDELTAVEPFGTRLESAWPVGVSAPTRAYFLESGMLGEDEPVGEIAFVRPEGEDKQVRYIGSPPPQQMRSLGISPPMPSASWIVQTRMVYSRADPIAGYVLRPTPEYIFDDSGGGNVTLDFSGVSNMWVMIDARGVGGNKDIMLFVDESVITSAFGYPVIRKEPFSGMGAVQSIYNRAWATVISPTKLFLVVMLSDGLPAGRVNSLGILLIEQGEGGGWDIVFQRHIAHGDMPHPLFAPHYRRSRFDRHEPIAPPMRSFLGLSQVRISSSNKQVHFIATMTHEMDGVISDWDSQLAVESFDALGVFRLTVDIESLGISTTITNVNTNLFHTTPTRFGFGRTQLEGNFHTTNDVMVSDHIDYPWDSGEWPVYCDLFFDGRVMHEMVGFVVGHRNDEPGGTGGGTFGASMVYADTTDRFQVTTTEWTEDGLVENVSSAYSSELSTQPYAVGGEEMSPYLVSGYPIRSPNGATQGGRRHVSMSYVGRHTYELQMHQGGIRNTTPTRWVIGRIDVGTGAVSEVPTPAGIAHPTSTCFARSRVVEGRDGEEITIPARTLVTYCWQADFDDGGNPFEMGVYVVPYTLELRVGDDIVAATHHTYPDEETGDPGDPINEFTHGVYYTGNPFARMRYGRMGEYDE